MQGTIQPIQLLYEEGPGHLQMRTGWLLPCDQECHSRRGEGRGDAICLQQEDTEPVCADTEQQLRGDADQGVCQDLQEVEEHQTAEG